ncbi:MAG: hypothetical protein HYS38_02635 [Acidobacteria bacterium]|nr:hypothetical protein [Acidobacteriota bacterium]
MTEFLVQASLGILSAIVAAYLTAKWSLKKFYSEKWWEHKERAYVEIIEALYDILQYCEIKQEDYGGGAGYSEEKMKELEERYSRAYWKLKKATDIGAFVVSPEAEIILKELSNRPQLEWDKSAPWDIFAQDYRYYRDTLAKIVDVARRDLKASNA